MPIFPGLSTYAAQRWITSTHLRATWIALAGQTRHIPLNADALNILQKWKAQSSDLERVFCIDTGFKSAWGKLLDAAKITVRFRWHDLRHHFASRLAQAGVPLNTIR